MNITRYGMQKSNRYSQRGTFLKSCSNSNMPSPNNIQLTADIPIAPRCVNRHKSGNNGKNA